MREWFGRFANSFTKAAGSHIATILAFSIVAVWFAFGPIFKFSDSYQMIINTGTTIITFLMVFLIQNTQNRDGKAVHLKLDELIAAVKSARNEMIDIEELSDEKLEEIAEFYREKKKEIQDQSNAVEEELDERVAEDDDRRVA